MNGIRVISRRTLLRSGLGAAMLISGCSKWNSDEPIKIGVLFSKTGSMAAAESHLADVVRFAVNRATRDEGISGREVAVVEYICNSDAASYQAGARILIEKHGVSAIVGCCISAYTKAVTSVIDEHKSLLISPTLHEGLKGSRRVWHTGSLPNQIISPAIRWAVNSVGTRVFLLGSDTIYQRLVSPMISEQLRSLDAELVGERYMLVGEQNMGTLISEIANSGADLVLNTLNGDSNLRFFEALSQSGVTATVMSFSVSGSEMNMLQSGELEGHLFAASYFEQIKDEGNQRFVDEYYQWSGFASPIGAVGYGIVAGIELWVAASRAANSAQADTVRHEAHRVQVRGPLGLLTLGDRTGHIPQYLHIARMEGDGVLSVLHSSSAAIVPIAYPPTRSKHAWDTVLLDFVKQWGGQWVAPGGQID